MSSKDILIKDLMVQIKYAVEKIGQSSKFCEDWDTRDTIRAIQHTFKEHSYYIKWKPLTKKTSNREAYLKYHGYAFAKVKISLSYDRNGHSKLVSFKWSEDLLDLLESKHLTIEKMTLKELFTLAIYPLSLIAQRSGKTESKNEVERYKKKINNLGCKDIYELDDSIRKLEMEKWRIERELKEKTRLYDDITKNNMKEKLRKAI